VEEEESGVKGEELQWMSVFKYRRQMDSAERADWRRRRGQKEGGRSLSD